MKKENVIVYLNIGGYYYTTDKSTLYRFGPCYFTSLLEGKFPVKKDNKGRYFINRPGKFFEPILEYMITGEVSIPDGMSIKSIVREARFYCIEFPLDESHESLSFVTDYWLKDNRINNAYSRIRDIADDILAIVLTQLKEKAGKNLLVESDPFLMEDQSRVNQWLDKTEHGNEYWRIDFIDRQKKIVYPELHSIRRIL